MHLQPTTTAAYPTQTFTKHHKKDLCTSLIADFFVSKWLSALQLATSGTRKISARFPCDERNWLYCAFILHKENMPLHECNLHSCAPA